MAVARARPSTACLNLARTLGNLSPRDMMVVGRRPWVRISRGHTWSTTDRGASTRVRRASSASMWSMATRVFPVPISMASMAPGLSRMNSSALVWWAHGWGGFAGVMVVIGLLLPGALCLPGWLCYNKIGIFEKGSRNLCPFRRGFRRDGFSFS